MDIEDAREVVERLGSEPAAELTRAETSELNRARFAIEKHEKAEAKKVAREAAKADDSALVEAIRESRGRAETGDATGHAALEARALAIYETLLERLEGIANSPHSTNQDLIGAAGHLRLASSVGKSDPAPTVYRLPMASLLGADGPRQDSTGPGEADSPPLSHETRQRDDDE